MCDQMKICSKQNKAKLLGMKIRSLAPERGHSQLGSLARLFKGLKVEKEISCKFL